MSILPTVTVRVRASGGRAADRAELERDAGRPVVRRCPACGGTDHGAPTVERGGASLSRAAGLCATAIADGPVGIDVVSVAEVVAAPLDAFAPSELPMLDGGRTTAVLWAAKEAVLKLDGRGLRVDPREVVVQADLASAAWTDADGASRRADLDVRDLGGDIVLVVAVFAS